MSINIAQFEQLPHHGKLKEYTSNTALRIAVHEAGHALLALEHVPTVSVELPALEVDATAAVEIAYAKTLVSADGLSDEALIEIVFGRI